MKEIFIIGAGPVGLHAACRLADKGHNVSVFEEHKKIGEPVQCSGILTHSIKDLIPIRKEFLVNELKRVKIYSKHSMVELPIDDIVVDRTKFDRWFAKEAKKKGVKIYTDHKFLGKRDSDYVFADKKNQFMKKKADILIGADGPMSDVAKFNLMFGRRDFYVGVQARVRGKFEKDCYSVYLGSIAPGFFAWVIPESSKVARIGIGAKTKVAKRFLRFLEVLGIKEKDVISKQGGLIPIYNTKLKVKKKGVYIIGDAACHVKTSTGGGIVPGIRAVNALVDDIEGVKDYEKGLVKVNGELKMHLRIRNMLDKFTDKDYDVLLKMINKRKVKKILHEVSRDNSSEMVMKLALAEPGFIRFASKTF